MKRNKSGISLIVLVITIIVMIILAAAVVIALDNSGIINKANEAVDTSNLKQVQTFADLIWAEAYMDKATLSEEEIREKLRDKGVKNDEKYNIEIKDNGIVVTIAGTSNNPGENIPIVDLKYTVTDGKATVTGIDYTSDPTMDYTPSPKRIVIPSTYEKDGVTYPVTAIADYAFWVYYAGGYSRIVSVEIPEGITSIGMQAFDGCKKLTSINLPSTLTAISDSAFSNCSGLTAINVAEGNTAYASEDGVLYNYAKTELVVCPANKTTITIPGSVTSIKSSAFNWQSSLTEIKVAEGNTTYASEDGVLYNYAKTQLIECPIGVTGSITIPSGVTSLNSYVLSACRNLMAINVAAGNTTYASEDGVLYNYAKTELIVCPSGKTTITIPASVTSSIYASRFQYCSALTAINVAEGNTAYSSEDGVLYNYAKTQLIASPNAKTTITIPASVTSIESSAFNKCFSLSTINVAAGNTAYTIEDGVLYNAAKTELIRCPNGKTTITIPASVTSVGEQEYYSGTTVFAGCTTLTEINVAEGNTTYVSEDGALYNKDKTNLIKCPAGKTTITIPSSITWLDGYDFSDCVKLTDIYYGGSNASNIYMSGSVPYDCTVHLNSTGPSSN